MKQGTVEFEKSKYNFVYPEGLESDLNVQISEIFEEEVYKLGRRKKDAIYIDIGANIGNSARYFYPFAKKIYAIEPNPDIYQCLVENTKSYPKIETFNFAIASGNGSDYLYSNESSPFPQTFWGTEKSMYTKEVQTKSLKTFMEEQKIDHVDVLKIDCEGSEYVIFPSETFREVAGKIDFIIGEGHYQNNAGFPQIIPDILNEYGFKTKFVTDGHLNYTRTFVFTDPMTGTKRRWTHRENTMFTAER